MKELLDPHVVEFIESVNPGVWVALFFLTYASIGGIMFGVSKAVTDHYNKPPAKEDRYFLCGLMDIFWPFTIIIVAIAGIIIFSYNLTHKFLTRPKSPQISIYKSPKVIDKAID